MRTKQIRGSDRRLFLPPGVGLKIPPTTSLPTASEAYEGEMRRYAGELVVCSKTGASSWAWETLSYQDLDARYGVITPADNVFRVVGSGDATKKLAFEVDGFTAGQTRTLTPPNFDGTIATLAGTETFTNKTLTTPTIGSFTNATHNHSNAAGGGNIASTAVTGLAAVWIATNSPSGAATSSFDNVFTSTYDNYLVVFRLAQSSANVSLNLRLRASSSDATGANYYSSQYGHNSSGTSGVAAASAATSWLLAAAGGAGVTNNDITGAIVISAPQDADQTLFTGSVTYLTSTPLITGGDTHGAYNATTQYDGITFLSGGGNITGTIRVYGLRDS